MKQSANLTDAIAQTEKAMQQEAHGLMFLTNDTLLILDNQLQIMKALAEMQRTPPASNGVIE